MLSLRGCLPDATNMAIVSVVSMLLQVLGDYLYTGATVTAVTWPCHFTPSPSDLPKMYPMTSLPGPSAVRQYSGQLARYWR